MRTLITTSQPFWGDMVAAAGAGPKPIPQQQLTVETLSEAITYCLSPEASRAAEEIASKIQSETGVEAAAKSFHKNLPTTKDMACDIIPHLPAAFMFEKGNRKVKMSSLAAEIMLENAPKEAKSLVLYDLPHYPLSRSSSKRKIDKEADTTANP